MHAINADSKILAIYDEAMKFAAHDCPACMSCGSSFFAQFRGRPDDKTINHLALKCGKCGDENCRWKL